MKYNLHFFSSLNKLFLSYLFLLNRIHPPNVLVLIRKHCNVLIVKGMLQETTEYLSEVAFMLDKFEINYLYPVAMFSANARSSVSFFCNSKWEVRRVRLGWG